MASNDRLAKQRVEIECYVGKIATQFAKLEDLLESLLACLISGDRRLSSIIIERGFGTFSRKSDLFKAIARYKYKDDERIENAIALLGKSNAIRREAAHAYIPIVNPGADDSYMGFHNPRGKDPMAKELSQDEMEENYLTLRQTNGLIFELLNECASRK